MKVYEFPQLGLENLKLVEGPEPQAGPHEVVVKFHAASLNYRELLFAWGLWFPRSSSSTAPLG